MGFADTMLSSDTLSYTGGFIMAVFPWKEKFSVNVEAMDKQHRYFLELLNNLDDQIRLKNNDETVKAALDKVFNYAAFHFRDEENILYTCGFPGVREQHQEHSFFMKQVKEMEESLQNGSRVQMGSLVGFLNDWFMNHIMREDKKYAAYIKIRNASECINLEAVRGRFSG
jgi:hemerythrin